ncbi:hypothetical protein [Caballeronia sp. DA-9]|uniref:hypothetical protein n=1 Tax=Caballeronia sp. DA-9 TaxID=3436237 RepID=UPI003F663173
MQQVFVLEFGEASAKLLKTAGVSHERITGAAGNGSGPFLMLTATDFSEINHWRLFLNREGCPYRYGEVEANGMREMGRSRSPGWVG